MIDVPPPPVWLFNLFSNLICLWAFVIIICAFLAVVFTITFTMGITGWRIVRMVMRLNSKQRQAFAAYLSAWLENNKQ